MYSKTEDDIISITNMKIGKISLVVTTFNEDQSIKKLIESVVSQSVVPDELIIVDGKSSDNTAKTIKKLQLAYRKKLTIELFIKKGNRSVGRNEGVSKSNGEIILFTDAGCILDKNWVKNIIKPFKDKSIDLVAGYYKGVANSIFQKCLIPYVLVMQDKIKNEFLPATRSMAIRKSSWNKTDGFNKNLSHNEDYAFANQAKKEGLKMSFAKDAIVNWIPRSTLKSAFIMFFRFALGDAQARIFRPKVLLIFARYLFAVYLIFLNLIINSNSLKLTTAFLFSGYILWTIWKNYKYVKNYKAIIYLPALQLLSDFAVITGTTIGFFSRLSLSDILKNIFKNKTLLMLTAIYIFLMSYIVNWGIPGIQHPFTYHMDEWHFSQSIRIFFKYGTTTVSGSANIPLYHVISSAFFLFPFYALKVIDPFAIKSALDNMLMQQKLFEVLRFHTMIYGVATIIVVYQILKKYIRFHPGIFTAFYALSPIGLLLSNYYKYDIVLTFWIVLTLYFILKFYETKKIDNFLFAGITSGLSLSTKFTAAPLLAIYVISYFIFSYKRKARHLLAGGGLLIFTFIFFGVPDLVFGKGNYQELFYSTLISGPKYSAELNINYPSWQFLIIKEFPSIFGYFLFYIFLAGFFYYTIYIAARISKKGLYDYKKELFLLISFILFLIPSISFGIEGGGNRALVLLPFIVLISSSFAKKIQLKKDRYIKNLVSMVLIIGFSINAFQAYSWYSVKFYDPRETSSRWLLENLPKGSEIGIENIPIYQMLPDVILKEYYLNQNDNNRSASNFKYAVIDENTKSLPKYTVVTNDFNNLSYVKNSSKKQLISKLNKLEYRKMIVFNANLNYYNYFSDKILLVGTNIMPVPVVISVYERK